MCSVIVFIFHLGMLDIIISSQVNIMLLSRLAANMYLMIFLIKIEFKLR